MKATNEALVRRMSAAVAILQSEFPNTVCCLIVAETPADHQRGTPWAAAPADVNICTTGMDSNETGLLHLALERVEASRAADVVLVPPQGK